MVPYGNPQISQIYLQDSKDYKVDVVVGADPLVAAFGSLSHDVIFAPINLGAKFYNVKDDYQLLGVVTWGNYYLISEQEITLESIKNQTIHVFGQNQVPNMLMHIINEHYDLNLSFIYLDSLPTAASYAAVHTDSIVLVSDPSYHMLLNDNDLFNGFNLNDVYMDITGGNNLPQAGVFVKKDLSQDEKNRIKTDIIYSIQMLTDDTENALDKAISLGLTWDREILSTVFLSNQISFVSALDAKIDIEVFFQYILIFQPMMIQNQLPNDLFYVGD